MNRPQISDFFPESTTPKDLNKIFLANPELYRYIVQLDLYVDWLEENRLNEKDSFHLNWIFDRMRNVHSENPNYDYMIRFKEIVNKIQKPDQ